jgi:hypothetical protein
MLKGEVIDIVTNTDQPKLDAWQVIP